MISTIHKSKGHEFDDVFLVLSDKDYSNEEKKRVLYVGMTRAKEHLYIINRGHCFSSDVVRRLNDSGVKFYPDNDVYAEPQKNMEVLTLRDVNLGLSGMFMKGIMTGDVISGDGLDVRVEVENERILFIERFSGKERILAVSSKKYFDTYKKKILSGYKVVGANVGFVVYWLDKDDMKEYKIVLPRMVFEKIKPEEDIV